MRLFTAVNFNDETKEEIAKIQLKLAADGVTGTFTDKANLHITLVFLGEFPGSSVAGFSDALEDVEFEPFQLELGGLGMFGRNILWLGSRPSPALKDMHRQLTENLMDMGFRPEERGFKPHVTLVRQPELPASYFLDAQKTPKIIAPIDTISLMKSERLHGKLVYTPIFSTGGQ